VTESRTRTITWQDPLAGLAKAKDLTGLEYMRAIVEGRLPPPPIAELLGFTILEVSEGRAVFGSASAEFLYNPIGVVHGGFAMTLLDSAMGVAVHSTMAKGERYTTLETKVNFVRPITADTGALRCEGAVVHRGRRVATAEGRLIAAGSGKLLAHGTTTCLIEPAAAEPVTS